MPLIKNPFAKDRHHEQITSDVLLDRKIEATAEEIQENSDKKETEVQAGLEQTAAEKIIAAEQIKQSRQTTPAQTDKQTPISSKSINMQKIETIMEEGMDDIFFGMDAAHQRLFKEEGERAARQIGQIIMTGKNVAVKILEILKKWLRLIPGVNKFFLEQEAKIKTDKILKTTEKDK